MSWPEMAERRGACSECERVDHGRDSRREAHQSHGSNADDAILGRGGVVVPASFMVELSSSLGAERVVGLSTVPIVVVPRGAVVPLPVATVSLASDPNAETIAALFILECLNGGVIRIVMDADNVGAPLGTERD